MNRTPYVSYQIIFDTLTDAGYSEAEAEQLLCDVIHDQREFDDYASRIHQILKDLNDEDKRS